MSPNSDESAYDLTVSSYEILGDDIVGITLRDVDDRPLPSWTPGAHIDLVLGPDLVRQYSLSGPPDDLHSWQIAVLKDPQSRGGSRFVHANLHLGAVVEVRGPRNNFELQEADRYIFIAGGIGITPLRPMIMAARAAGAEWTLLYGGRSRGSMAYLGEFTDPSLSTNVQIVPHDEAGLLDLAAHLSDPHPGTLIYCCGPESLLNAVEEGSAHWPADSLHLERFRAKVIDGAVDSQFEVELQNSNRVLTVRSDQTILQALQEADIDVLSSCEEGTCGTCIADVVDGTPEHRDSVLTQEERDSGNILVCVSRALSPRLVLDL